MKYKKKLANLAGRQKVWESGGKTGPGGHTRQKPGSQTK